VKIDLNLLEDTLTVRVCILIYDLDGVFHACVDIATRKHLTVGSSAEYLTSKRVDVRETGCLHVSRKPSFLFSCRVVVVIIVIIIRGCCFVSIRIIIISIRVWFPIVAYVLDVSNVYDRFATTTSTIIYNVYANTGTFMIAIVIEQSIIVVVSIMTRAAVLGGAAMP